MDDTEEIDLTHDSKDDGQGKEEKKVDEPPKPAERGVIRASLPWVEKHRPRTLHGCLPENAVSIYLCCAEIVGHQETLRRLQAIAAEGNMPNILLSGPPGSGKTTCMQCLARELLGSAYDKAVLELNASDARSVGEGVVCRFQKNHKCVFLFVQHH